MLEGSAARPVRQPGLSMSERPRVLIVGAGATGAAFAWRAASAGLDVTCLERGRWNPPVSTPSTGPDWEWRRLRDRSPNPNIRRLPEDYPILDDTSPIKPAIFNGVGGSTILWSAHVPRFRAQPRWCGC